MLKVLDTTLREGEQMPGICFAPHVRMTIAKLLDEIGVDFIEVGHPAVTERIRRSVAEIARCGLSSRIGAHARSLRHDVDLALECGVGFLGVFYCVAERRLAHHARDLAAATDRICDVIAHARRQRPDLIIRYTPEDTVRSDWSNVIAAATAAVQAGADIISIADTTGYLIPGTERSMFRIVTRMKEELASKGFEPMIAVHCHRDRGLALANALDGIRAGAEIVDASVLGLGERAGLVDLATLLTVAVADLGAEPRWRLDKLMHLYEMVSKFAGVAIPPNQPIVGANAFTHCAGVHTQAALADPLHYQSLDPALVGRTPRFSLDHMSGQAAIQHALEAIGEDSEDTALVQELLHKIKEIGETGRVVELDELRMLVSYLKSSGAELPTAAVAGA